MGGRHRCTLAGDDLMPDDHLDPDRMPTWLSGLWPSGNCAPFLLAGVNDDDCAVMRWDDHLLVVTTDYLNSNPIAVQLGIADMSVLGRLVVAANVADLLSTGAQPRALLIGLTMPYDAATADFKSVMKGVKREADKVGIPVVGGDSKLASALAIFAVAIGSAADSKELLLKNAVQADDDVWVSGNLGACSAAVLGFSQGDLSTGLRKWAVEVLTRPSLPIIQSRQLAQSHAGHGGIDVSDGLGEDIHRLCDASNVGVVVNANSIPVDHRAARIAAIHSLPPWSLAFASGGDFQFVATAASQRRQLLQQLGFHRIGRMHSGRRRSLLLADGNERPLPRTGHRDARHMTFHDEIMALAREASNA